MVNESKTLIEKLETENSELNEQVTLLKTQTSSISDSEKDEKIKSLENQISELESHNEYFQNCILELQNRATELEELNMEYQTRLEEYETYIKSITPVEEFAQAEAYQNEQNGISENKSSNAKTLRKFCDICEEFDLHDTEDCPQQSSAQQDQSSHTRYNAPKRESRAYCDNCEVFGHETSNCPNSKQQSDDDQTF